MSPKFSVIIATYNSAHTLSKAIDSVLEQSYLAYEIVIVDDGSTDDTFLVVSNYGDKVRYHLQDNSGVSAARNKGAEMARGDWLAFLDADDWYYPQRLYWHAELLVRHVKLDFLIGDYCYVREDGSVIRRSIQSNPYGRKVLASADEYASVLLDEVEIGELLPSYFGHTSTLSLPRDKFLALGGFPLEFSIAEDLHLFVRLCATSYKAGIICNPMAVYYVHDAGLIRADIINAQTRTVQALCSLKNELCMTAIPIRNGFLSLLLLARLDLATALIRHGQHLKAIKSMLPAVIESFSWRSLMALLSIIKG